jgi:hypothetical protein
MMPNEQIVGQICLVLINLIIMSPFILGMLKVNNKYREFSFNIPF